MCGVGWYTVISTHIPWTKASHAKPDVNGQGSISIPQVELGHVAVQGHIESSQHGGEQIIRNNYTIHYTH